MVVSLGSRGYTATVINWYPGHMHKAMRLLKPVLQQASIVLEVRDVRAPVATANPALHQALAEVHPPRPLLTVLTHKDCVQNGYIKSWLQHFKSIDHQALAVDARHPHTVREISSRLAKMAQHTKHPRRPGRVRKVAVVGIPNLGKSTLLNSLCQKRIAKVGNVPAVTKGVNKTLLADTQWIDSPGVLPPRLDDQVGARLLSVLGAIRDVAYHEEEVVVELIRRLAPRLVDVAERYGLDTDTLSAAIASKAIRSDAEDAERGSLLTSEIESVLHHIAERAGFMHEEGELDVQAAAKRVLVDYRRGALGAIGLENPGDFDWGDPKRPVRLSVS